MTEQLKELKARETNYRKPPGDAPPFEVIEKRYPNAIKQIMDEGYTRETLKFAYERGDLTRANAVQMVTALINDDFFAEIMYDRGETVGVEYIVRDGVRIDTGDYLTLDDYNREYHDHDNQEDML